MKSYKRRSKMWKCHNQTCLCRLPAIELSRRGDFQVCCHKIDQGLLRQTLVVLNHLPQKQSAGREKLLAKNTLCVSENGKLIKLNK